MSERAAMHAISPQTARQGGMSPARNCACGRHTIVGARCPNCGRSASLVQRQGDGAAAPPVLPDPAQDVLQAPGKPLDAAVRRFMEPRFGRDFSTVRVHTDDQAAAAAGSLNAAAYTAGDRIVFGRDRYAPQRPGGLHLLAHELSHVAQQHAATGLQRQPLDHGSETALEREADRAADAALGGTPLPRLSTVAGKAVQRQTADAKAPASAQPAQRHDKQELKDAGRDGKRFDALLDREAGALAITMCVAFEFKDIAGPINDPWTDARRTQWKNEFIRANVARWSNRYVLVPNGPCAAEPMSSVKVLIDVQEDYKTPHFHVTVDNDAFPAKSGVSIMEREGTFHPDDVRRQEKVKGTYQTTAEHEFGHMLGLHHIHCNGNEKECYGLSPTAEPGEKEDVMGAGSEVSKRDYEVFSEVLQQMTGCNWKVDEIPTSLTGLWIALGVVGAGLIGVGAAALAGAFKKGH